MIENKSKIKMAISNIQKFLINFKNQPSDLQEDLKKDFVRNFERKRF